MGALESSRAAVSMNARSRCSGDQNGSPRAVNRRASALRNVRVAASTASALARRAPDAVRRGLHDAGNVASDDRAEAVAGFLGVPEGGLGSEALGRQALGIEERLRQRRADALQFVAHELVAFG